MIRRRCSGCKYFVPEDLPWGEESLGLGYGTCRLREISVKGSDSCSSWAPKHRLGEEE
ncbi:MAG: hypothetical protein N3C62_03740 [Synergistetes bacterium]|nr:hypothetical protein [Synergistota bacterium]MCX8127839.1 hypothetical protein [Synergistota bacterium]MDW8192101.1 hypothetical protein [Synergistota bacterium]